MTGEELYTMYSLAHEDNDISVDDWDDLDLIDHQIWDSLALLVEQKYE